MSNQTPLDYDIDKANNEIDLGLAEFFKNYTARLEERAGKLTSKDDIKEILTEINELIRAHICYIIQVRRVYFSRKFTLLTPDLAAHRYAIIRMWTCSGIKYLRTIRKSLEVSISQIGSPS